MIIVFIFEHFSRKTSQDAKIGDQLQEKMEVHVNLLLM